MEALGGPSEARPEGRAFRAVDAFAVEAWKAARQMGRGDGEALAAELRAQVARCGGALLAGPKGLEAAQAALSRCRFAVYLGRRLGLLDLRAYRLLAARGDAAERELSLRGP